MDIKGFKSFPDKTHISLDHPVTGIVGPNGCGKSNIIDAVRWVIGEHKIKSLRSDNLDDLVFNGSKGRSPSGMAEVSITFENTKNLLPTEFSTVTITRKFYKSGESEYRLNDVICRLRDIHNLLMDTGVSSDSYAIIELGMVDDIIKDKEGSRRRMLEQAAGISIYKTRKKEAHQKLNATESDISRIDDLLFEIGNNLRTLENQAKKAERYYQIKNDYKKISIDLARASLEEYNEKYQSLNSQLKEEEDRKLRIDSEISGDEAQIEANKLILAQQEQDLSFSQKKFNDLINRIRILEGEKKLAAQHLNHLQEREQNLKTLLENAASQLALLKESITHLNHKLNEEQESLEDLRDMLDDQRAQLDEKRTEFDLQKQKIEEQRTCIQQIQLKQFELEKTVAVGDSNLGSLKKNQFQIEEEKQNRNQEIEQLKNDEISLNESADRKSKELREYLSKKENLQSKIQQTESISEDFKQLLIKNNRQLDAKQNEYELLKSLLESLEGYPDSIKFLKKNEQWQYPAPLLSDIFIVEEDYRIALEAVLDNYLNFYIVKNVNEASEAIHLLQLHKKGKANFFLLNQFKEYIPRTISVQEQLTPALNVIKVEQQYQNLVNYLLGNVFIASSEGGISEEFSDDILIVEKSGKYLHAKYSLSGGSVGLFEGNKIGRAKNIERLEKEIASLKEQSGHLESQINLFRKELADWNTTLRQLPIEQTKLEINQLNNQLNNLQNRKEHFQQLNESSESKLIEIQEQIADRMEDLEDSKMNLEDVNGDLEELKLKLNEASTAFSLVEQDYNLTTQQYNNQHIQLTKQQSILESLKQEINFKSNQISDLEKQIAASSTQIQETSQKISETSGKLNFGDNELQDLIDQKEIDEQTLNEKDRKYYAFRNEVSEHEQKISKQRRAKEQAEVLLNSFKEKLSEMKLQVAGLKERLSVEFKVELEDILEEEMQTELSMEDLQSEAERLKKRLENIGEVNPTAIEAYQEIKIRHDFIVEQKDDLEDAKRILMETIEEVERTANSRFKETFDQVSINFKQVFQALFTEEDHADLKLTDPENVAESGIEIYAQPKGKRPSTLTQLSGGEKTLTSTAFLFAIYLIKPAPFCILDEVDAPLDDANVGKFTQMIRQFSDNSQFIIVTHNKQTMAAVDVIYGVTMQEPGVSKIVPVDFRSLSN